MKINAAGLEDKKFVAEMLEKTEDLERKAELLEKEILEIVTNKIS